MRSPVALPSNFNGRYAVYPCNEPDAVEKLLLKVAVVASGVLIVGIVCAFLM